MLHSCKSDDAQAAREMADSHRRLKAEVLSLEQRCRHLSQAEAAAREAADKAIHELNQLRGHSAPMSSPPPSSPPPPQGGTLQRLNALFGPGVPSNRGVPVPPPMAVDPHSRAVVEQQAMQALDRHAAADVRASLSPPPRGLLDRIEEGRHPGMREDIHALENANRQALAALERQSLERHHNIERHRQAHAIEEMHASGPAASVRQAIEDMRDQREPQQARYGAASLGVPSIEPPAPYYGAMPTPASPSAPPWREAMQSVPPPQEQMIQPTNSTASALQSMKAELARVRAEMSRRAQEDAVMESQVDRAFDHLDANKDGLISRAEWHNAHVGH